MKCVALYLKGPLQSWGVGAKFGIRPTMSYPSRSGVLGLIAAACGIDRTDDAWLERVSSLRITARTYCTQTSDSRGNKSLRNSDGLRLYDYHTVGGGRDEAKKGSWTYRMNVAKAEGGVKTELTTRDYLQDAAFGVVVSGDDVQPSQIDEIAVHLENPVWGIWLGRKCCIPTEPVLVGVYESQDEAWTAISKRAERSGRVATMSLTEVSPGSSDVEDILMDDPISFARREFATRAVSYPGV